MKLMSGPGSGESAPQYLESKKYYFVADGTMPVLNFEIKSGKLPTASSSNAEERLTLEIYHPMSGEVFEAKFRKGRIEVDRDGSVTYFTTSQDHARFSIFLERNIAISIDKSGEVEIRSPSKILSVKKAKGKKSDPSKVESDTVVLQLEWHLVEDAFRKKLQEDKVVCKICKLVIPYVPKKGPRYTVLSFTMVDGSPVCYRCYHPNDFS